VGSFDPEYLRQTVEESWENGSGCGVDVLAAVLQGLDQGVLRAAEKEGTQWRVNSWLKKAILLYFKGTPTRLGGAEDNPFYDKIPLKCAQWGPRDFQESGFRLAPGAVVRQGAFLGPQVIAMPPSFVNVGAYVGPETLIDSNTLVGCCAQVGRKCHISAGVTLGGVLEPLQAHPVIIEDNCFVGAGCILVEGVQVGEGAVLGTGVRLGASTKIVHRETGEISYGSIPPYAVVVPGSVACEGRAGLALDCAVILKQVDAATREKVALNDLLRF